jgi:hypothetical protein
MELFFLDPPDSGLGNWDFIKAAKSACKRAGLAREIDIDTAVLEDTPNQRFVNSDRISGSHSRPFSVSF